MVMKNEALSVYATSVDQYEPHQICLGFVTLYGNINSSNTEYFMYYTPPQCFILLTCSIPVVSSSFKSKWKTVWILISWLLEIYNVFKNKSGFSRTSGKTCPPSLISMVVFCNNIYTYVQFSRVICAKQSHKEVVPRCSIQDRILDISVITSGFPQTLDRYKDRSILAS